MEIDRRIKIRHLRTFVEVARVASVGRAAELMHVSQPAVSKTLAELEAVLGARLMDRNRSGVSLTPVGQMFHAYASSSLAALRQGIEGISETLAAGGLRLAIGALPSVAARIVPDAAVEMGRVAPEVGLAIVTGPNGYLLSELAGGALDLVIGRLGNPEAMAGLSFSQLYSERISFVVRPGHPLVGCSDIGQISNYQIVFPNRDAAIRTLVEQFFIAQGLRQSGHRIETVAETFGRAYVRKTDAVWVISSGVVALDVSEGTLVELPIATRETLGPVGLTMRGDGDPSPALRMVIEAVRRTVVSLGLSS